MIASLGSPFTTTGLVTKFRAGCAPIVIRSLLVLSNLYRHHKRNDHGFPFRESRSSGSKLSLFLPIERFSIAAGFPNEKVGTREIPLLVTETEPEKWLIAFVLSISSEEVTIVCEKERCEMDKSTIKNRAFLKRCSGIIKGDKKINNRFVLLSER